MQRPHRLPGEAPAQPPGFRPQDIANLYGGDWESADPHITPIEIPFRLRPEDPSVKHVLIGREYLIVHERAPYQPEDIWETPKLAAYKLKQEAEAENISVFLVPPDVVTLSAVMNDAIDGNPELFVSVFTAIGTMFRDITDAYAEQEKPITSTITLDDVAFVKGRKEPLLLPPFSLDFESTDTTPLASLARDIYRMPLDAAQQQVVEDALVAFEEAYEGPRSN